MTPSSSNKRSCLLPALWLMLFLGCIGLVAFSLFTSPASAAFFEAPTPTQEDLWAHMDLPKPTNTATPLPPATDIPTFTPESTLAPTATEIPAQLVMEIVNGSSQSSSQPQAPAPAYGGSKLILVDISEQHMYVYDGDTLVYSFVVSTGIGNSTRVGNFAVQSKIPNAYGSTWDLWMPNWLGIYYSHGLENGIHALPILSSGATLWAGFLGRPVSYGCVVLDTYDSQLLYDWAEIGTPVEIQW
jgi:lipoprotein-anchoring transpeptidase ErfK/SrfK